MAKDSGTVNSSTHNHACCLSTQHLLPPPPPSFPYNEAGEPVTHIGGLEYYPNFFTAQEQEELLKLIDSQPWQSGIIARRQQFYGEIYYHTSFKSSRLQPNAVGGEENDKESAGCDSNNEKDSICQSSSTSQGISLKESGMQAWLERTRPFFPSDQPLPSQVLINEYRNNMGIASHFEDFEAFGPIIVTISLVQPVYMTLKKPTQKTNGCDDYHDIVKILLEPGSLLVMKDETRYEYRHGIGKSKWVHYYCDHNHDANDGSGDCNDGERSVSGKHENMASNTTMKRRKQVSIRRNNYYRRVSLTIRHLLHTRRKVEGLEDEQDTIKDPSVY
jgi:alkylated DNA repair dioxygenase AlkB